MASFDLDLPPISSHYWYYTKKEKRKKNQTTQKGLLTNSFSHKKQSHLLCSRRCNNPAAFDWKGQRAVLFCPLGSSSAPGPEWAVRNMCWTKGYRCKMQKVYVISKQNKLNFSDPELPKNWKIEYERLELNSLGFLKELKVHTNKYLRDRWKGFRYHFIYTRNQWIKLFLESSAFRGIINTFEPIKNQIFHSVVCHPIASCGLFT